MRRGEGGVRRDEKRGEERQRGMYSKVLIGGVFEHLGYQSALGAFGMPSQTGKYIYTQTY